LKHDFFVRIWGACWLGKKKDHRGKPEETGARVPRWEDRSWMEVLLDIRRVF